MPAAVGVMMLYITDDMATAALSASEYSLMFAIISPVADIGIFLEACVRALASHGTTKYASPAHLTIAPARPSLEATMSCVLTAGCTSGTGSVP